MRLQILLFVSLLGFLCASCNEEFLDVKRNISQVVPNKAEDFQAVLDNTSVVNGSSSHELGMLGADEFYLTDDRWEIIGANYQKEGYIWADVPFGEADVPDWNNAYYRILHANLCIDACLKDSENRLMEGSWQAVFGQALFIRAYNHYQLAQEFVPSYTEDVKSIPLGLPLRLEYDITVAAPRSTVEETYRSILADMRLALPRLPVAAMTKYRPNRAAGYALMAKAYLQMHDYTNARLYADSCLQLNNDLIDFADVNSTLTFPFATDFDQNVELLFICTMTNIPATARSRINMDEELLGLYEDGDLRKSVYYGLLSGKTVFNGSYRGNAVYFTGLATDEIYLIRAEGNARMGRLREALADLNRLRKYRFAAASHYDLESSDADQVMQWVVDEKRRELVFRGTRWEDLRRWNKYPALRKEVRRQLMGVDYVLTPNSNKYVWPIPFNEIDQAELEQNPR